MEASGAMRRYTEIESRGGICGACNGSGQCPPLVFNRVDIDPPESLADRLARVITDHLSRSPGRLAISEDEIKLADTIVQRLKEWGALKPGIEGGGAL